MPAVANVTTLVAIEQPVMLFMTVVFSTRFLKAVVDEPPPVPDACDSLKMAMSLKLSNTPFNCDAVKTVLATKSVQLAAIVVLYLMQARWW